jgi:hypothetical protein
MAAIRKAATPTLSDPVSPDLKQVLRTLKQRLRPPSPPGTSRPTPTASRRYPINTHISPGTPRTTEIEPLDANVDLRRSPGDMT